MSKRMLGLLLFFLVITTGAGTVYATEPAITDSALLWLVNQDHRLEETFEPDGISVYSGYSARAEAIDAFDRMITDMRAQQINGLRIQSAYRTYSHQQQIFKNKKTILLGLGYKEETAIEMTSRSIAFPGASEHQTGLALDVTLDGTLKQSFANTAAGRWINNHAHEYGFIVRYAAEKTDITRIIYEPWHLRYVGMPHSAFMKEKDLCFEEYIDYLKANGMYIYWGANGEYYLVMYTAEPDTQQLRNVIDVSTDHPGVGAAYIITMKKPYPDTGAFLEKEPPPVVGRFPTNW